MLLYAISALIAVVIAFCPLAQEPPPDWPSNLWFEWPDVSAANCIKVRFDPGFDESRVLNIGSPYAAGQGVLFVVS
jgi:hypothetical protein